MCSTTRESAGTVRPGSGLNSSKWRGAVCAISPTAPLSEWFHERTAGAKGRIRRVMIVALARKLLIALWRFAETGLVPSGAKFA